MKMDMSNEKMPGGLLKEGWRPLKVIDCQEGTSKKNNPKIVLNVEDVEEGTVKEMHLTAVPGKRWNLKLFLNACDIQAGEDKVYYWNCPDVLEKIVLGKVEYYEDTFIDRNNKERTVIKDRITSWKKDDSQSDIPF